MAVVINSRWTADRPRLLQVTAKDMKYVHTLFCIDRRKVKQMPNETNALCSVRINHWNRPGPEARTCDGLTGRLSHQLLMNGC